MAPCNVGVIYFKNLTFFPQENPLIFDFQNLTTESTFFLVRQKSAYLLKIFANQFVMDLLRIFLFCFLFWEVPIICDWI